MKRLFLIIATIAILHGPRGAGRPRSRADEARTAGPDGVQRERDGPGR